MVKIALVTKNKCNFDRMEEFLAPMLYKPRVAASFKIMNDKLDDYVWSVMEPHVTFVDIETDAEEFISGICQNLIKCFPDMSFDDFFYKTESSYSSPTTYLEFVYTQPIWESYVSSQPEQMNNIGCLMSLKHTVIENNIVVIANKYDLSAPKFVTQTDVSKCDLIRVVRRRFFSSAVLIKNNNLIKYYYQNPVALASTVFNLDYEKDSIETVSFTHLKYNLLFFFKQDKTQYVNKCATRIYGRNKIYGDVLVLHELDEKVFANLNIYEIKKINLLSYGKLSDRELSPEENFTIPELEPEAEGQTTKLTPLWSRYLVLHHRSKKLETDPAGCAYCKKKLTETKVVCPHCYRIKYCSTECCIRDFGTSHFEDCVYL